MVRSLVHKWGTPLTLQRVGYSMFSPTKGEYTSTATSSFVVYGVIRASYRMWAGERFYFGVEVQSGDRDIIISTSASVTPLVGDIIQIKGVAYRLVVCQPVTPGGTDLLYKTLCRR